MKLSHKLKVENIEPINLLTQKSHGQRNYHYKENLSNRTFILPNHKIGPLLGTWLNDYPQRILFILTEEKERGGK